MGRSQRRKGTRRCPDCEKDLPKTAFFKEPKIEPCKDCFYKRCQRFREAILGKDCDMEAR